MGEKVFFSSQSENHYLHISSNILASFPVILLFWSLSLSPVWLNIEGRQDFRYKTPILFFYSENNSDSLNRSPNTNLLIVHWPKHTSAGYRSPLVDRWMAGFADTASGTPS